MNTKIVYVLVSDSSDCYYEQTLISAYSLKHWNPDAKITLIVDDITDKTLLEVGRNGLEFYISEKKIVCLPKVLNKMQRSRCLKTSIRNIIDGDYLYIDSDTVVVDSLAEIDSLTMNIACVPDAHHSFDRNHNYIAIERAAKLGYNVSEAKFYWNGGVMYVKDNVRTREFMARWNNLCKDFQKVGMNYDQPPLLVCDLEFHIIEQLPGEYNCQILNGGLSYLGYAKIIHPYSIIQNDSFYLFMDNKYLNKIKAQGCLLEEDKALIQRGKSQFMTESVIAYGRTLEYYKATMFHLYMKNPHCFKFLNFAARLITKFLNLIKC